MKKYLISSSLILLLSAVCAFKVPTKARTNDMVIASNVTEEIEDVKKELELANENVKKQELKPEFTPLVLLVVEASEVVELTVAASRVALAATRAASAAVAVATRNSCGQLLRQTVGQFKGIEEMNENPDFIKMFEEFYLG